MPLLVTLKPLKHYALLIQTSYNSRAKNCTDVDDTVISFYRLYRIFSRTLPYSF